MADSVSRLHTEFSAGTAGLEAGVGRAKASLAGFGGAAQQAGGHLEKLANRMDRGDIVNGFNNISQSIGHATGMGEKFGNFMSGFILSASTGGLAGAAFGAAIGGVNLILEKFNENMANAPNKMQKFAEGAKRTAEVLKTTLGVARGGIMEDYRRGVGRGRSEESELADLKERMFQYRLENPEKTYQFRGRTYLETDLVYQEMERRRSALESRIAGRPGVAAGIEGIKGKGDAGKADKDFIDQVVQSVFGGSDAGRAMKPSPERVMPIVAAVAAAAFMNPAIIAGSQADLEMQARLDAELTDLEREQLAVQREIRDKLGMAPAVF